jgi:RHS repeat-associated protein
LIPPFIYGQSELTVEQINNTTGTVTYLHHDQQGSTRLLTSSTGVKEATFTYSPYGELTGSTGTATTPLGYDGQYTSSDTGLIYLRARVYDPATAQFLSVDPLASSTREPYVYAGDDPLTYRDRSGLGIEEVFEGGSGIPCPWCAAQEDVQEALEGAYHEIQHGAEWVYNHVGTEELDEPADQGAAASENACGPERNPAQDKKLSPGQIKRLKEAGFDPHELKLGAGEDLYMDSEGNIYAKPQGGAGPGEPIGINIKNLP